MIEEMNETQRCQITNRTVYYRNQIVFHLIMFLILVLMIVACSSPPKTSSEVIVQAALPTPTREPTFTPSPLFTSSPQFLPTATTQPEAVPTPAPEKVVLSGQILDQDTNQPIAEAQVSAGTASTTTGTNGGYTLTGLPPGQYVLSVTHPDYDPGLSSIFTVAAGEEPIVDVPLYAPDTSPYPEDPMLTNPLDPNGAWTEDEAIRLAQEQGLTGEVVGIEEATLTGEYLVNYKIGDNVRAAVAELNHEAWELTDGTGRTWWIIKVCGNLASPLPAQKPIPAPKPVPLSPMAEVVIDELIVRACTSEACAEVGTVPRGERVEVFGCLADHSWCEVSWPGGRGWCTGQSLRRLAVARAVPVVEAALPTAPLGTALIGKGKIAFVSNRDGNAEIYVMNPDGSGLTRLTDHPASDSIPAWSPDSRQIAFVSNRDGNDQIYVMNADGSGLTQLTFEGDNCCPAWSPDGHQIVFESTRDDPDPQNCDKPEKPVCNRNIYVMNTDGSRVMLIIGHPSFDGYPAWSPDGRQIAFTSGRDGNGENYILNIDGSVSRLTEHPAWDTSPKWSPDGQYIVFASERDGNHEVYVMNADGSGLRQLTDHPSFNGTPTWSPDGQRIAFLSNRDGNNQIYVMNADGSGLTQLTSEGINCCPAWSR